MLICFCCEEAKINKCFQILLHFFANHHHQLKNGEAWQLNTSGLLQQPTQQFPTIHQCMLASGQIAPCHCIAHHHHHCTVPAVSTPTQLLQFCTCCSVLCQQSSCALGVSSPARMTFLSQQRSGCCAAWSRGS